VQKAKGCVSRPQIRSSQSAIRNLQFAILLFLLLIAGGCAAPAPTPTPDADVIPAHNFELANLDGGNLALADLRGQWVIVNFWATWCIPCRQEMPFLQNLSAHYPDRLMVIGINQREDVSAVHSFVAELQIDFPILLHPDDETLLAYQVMGLPRTAVVDPQGNVAAIFLGRVDENPSFQTWLTMLD
jgi:thiol-disulfide isomerase/thioredoxin